MIRVLIVGSLSRSRIFTYGQGSVSLRVTSGFTKFPWLNHVTFVPFTVTACNVAQGWHHHDNSCYKIFTVKKTWDEAKTSCDELGASLLTIHSAGENAFVTETLLTPSGQNFMIALRDFGKNGSFVWADNSTVDFLNWNNGEPNNIGHETCSHMYSHDGKWNNYPCSHTLSYVCKKPWRHPLLSSRVSKSHPFVRILLWISAIFSADLFNTHDVNTDTNLRASIIYTLLQ